MAHLKILERLAALEQSHEVLKEDYAELKVKHEHTLQELSEAKGTIKKLEKKLSKYEIKKDSTNSSIPPSQDPHRKKNISLRKSTGKKSGGQQGHKGTHLKMTDSPDDIVNHYAHQCPNCNNEVNALDQELQSRFQVIDIPLIKPITTEHRVYQVDCPCCNKTAVPKVTRSGKAPVVYGPNIEHLIAYWSVRQYVPFNRITEMLTSCFGLNISEGTVANMLNKLSTKCQGVYDQLKKNLSTAKVLGSDETSMNVNGKNHWLWTWQNDKMTFLSASDSRGFKTVESLFPDGLESTILVSDRLSAQLKQKVANHQICLAHILRNIIYYQQSSKSGWFTNLDQVLRQGINYKKHNQAENLDALKILEIQTKLDKLLEKELKQGTSEAHYQKQLRKVSNYLLTFLYHKEVPPDNNASERAIRNAKVKQKVSTMFKSTKGMKVFAVLRSIIDTGIKLGIQPLEALSNPQLIIAE